MKKLLMTLLLSAILISTASAQDNDAAIQQLQQALQDLRNDYEQRLNDMEQKLQAAVRLQQEQEQQLAQQKMQQEEQKQALHVQKQEMAVVKQQAEQIEQIEPAKSKSFVSGLKVTPNMSVILDGRYADLQQDGERELPGFTLAGEAEELPEEGFSIGHTEVALSANVDDKFYGKFTLAYADHDGESETEVEEAFIQTLGIKPLPGAGVRAGRFMSAVGYINEIHEHAWDFIDAPLVYDGMWGKKYIDDGVRLSYVAPIDNLYLEVGADALAGDKFPGGDERHRKVGSQVYFAKLGGDINDSHSWQANLSYTDADVKDRSGAGHSHGGGPVEIPIFNGDSETYGVGAVYKWAPKGNFKNQNVKLQGEFFKREEDGHVRLTPTEDSSVDSDQYGYYVQGIYQFHPQWRTGVRYDRLQSSHDGNDPEVLEEAGFFNENIKPERTSAMIEWLPSEFSRIRLQYNHDESSEEGDDQIFIQYTMSLGDHGAHAY